MTIQIITPSIKDNVLFYLCNNAAPERVCSGKTSDILREVELDFDTFNAVLQQFQRYSLIENLNLTRNHMSFVLRVDAHDYAQQGGFVAQEEVFKANLDKLILEIDNLKKQLEPNQLETINKIASIASAIFGGLSLFKK